MVAVEFLSKIEEVIPRYEGGAIATCSPLIASGSESGHLSVSEV